MGSIRCILGVIIASIMLGGCLYFREVPPPVAPAPLPSLLIESSLFPDWQAEPDEVGGGSATFLDDDNLENIVRQFRRESPWNIATQFLWRYRSPAAAQRQYEAILKQQQGWGRDITRRDGITYQSKVAQHMTIFCESAGFCHVIAQYGVYVSHFTVWIDKTTMRQSEFELVLRHIDQKMSAIANL